MSLLLPNIEMPLQVPVQMDLVEIGVVVKVKEDAGVMRPVPVLETVVLMWAMFVE